MEIIQQSMQMILARQDEFHKKLENKEKDQDLKERNMQRMNTFENMLKDLRAVKKY